MQSPAYEKARKKNPLLPEIKDRASLENTFKLLPLSMLAIRVVKVEPQASNGKKTKRVKGQWTVKVEPQQECQEDLYYIWLWEGSQIKTKLYALLALVAIFAIVLYPLWPLVLRQGVYYLSWGLLGLLGLFFLMAIFRVILFCVTYFVTPPGLWLFPNLWEDVSFMDSFKPFWAWHEVSLLSIFSNKMFTRLTRCRPKSPRRRRRPRLLAPLQPASTLHSQLLLVKSLPLPQQQLVQTLRLRLHLSNGTMRRPRWRSWVMTSKDMTRELEL